MARLRHEQLVRFVLYLCARTTAHFTSSVEIIPSHSSSPAPVTLQQANVVALKFSPLSSYLFTFERPVKTESGEMYKNAKAWDVKNGEIVGGWYQKTMEDWCVYYR